MICFVVVVVSQKGWNGLRSDQAPTFRPNWIKIEVLYGMHVPLASSRHTFMRQMLESSHHHELHLRLDEIFIISYLLLSHRIETLDLTMLVHIH